MKRLGWGLLALLILACLPAKESGAAAELHAEGASHSLTVHPGERVTYQVQVSRAGAAIGERIDLSGYIPTGFVYVPGSTTINGDSSLDPTVSGSNIRWDNLPGPGAQPLRLGFNTFVQDSMDGPHIDEQLQWTRALTGPGGYVRQLIYPIVASTSGAKQQWKDFVNAAYDHDLIPVLRLQGYFNPTTGYWDKPEQDYRATYLNVAQAFRRVVADLPRRDGHLLYLEIWNEPNMNADWGGEANPAEYGRFLLAVGQAIRSLADPRIVIMNGGLAPGGDYNNLDFVNTMFREVPAAAYSFDVWASHPYAGNRPPEYNNSPHSIRGYQWELAQLSHYRNVSDMKVMATEAGYALGNHEDPNYPAIDEANRAVYTRQAVENIWSKDRMLLAVMLFELADPSNRWPTFDWVFPTSGTLADGSPSQVHPVYDSVRAIPRPVQDLSVTFELIASVAEGSYQPALQATTSNGTIRVPLQPVVVTRIEDAGVISGRVLLEGHHFGSGVRVSAGKYSTFTGADGSFQLAVQPGLYTVIATAPGFTQARWDAVSALPGKLTELPDASMIRGCLLGLDPEW